MVAWLCEQDDEAAFPAVWSLAIAGHQPFPVQFSLDQVGVHDGQLLYLRDTAASEVDDPVVLDMDEAVSEAAGQPGMWPWDPRNRAVTWLVIGALWLIAAAAVGAARHDHGLIAALTAVTAVTFAAVAGAAARRRWPVPGAVSLLLAVSAVPTLALAGGLVGNGHAAAAAVAGGAVIGAVLALAAVPGTATTALGLLACLGFAVCLGLSVAHANATESAAVLAVILLSLSGLGPQVMARLIAYSPFEPALPEADSTDTGTVAVHVRRAWLLLLLYGIALGAGSAVDLIWLARSGSYFAQGLTACASLALILNAGTYRQLTVVVPGLAAGVAGLLAVVLAVPARLDFAPWTGPAAATAIGLGMLLAGLAGSFSSRQTMRQVPAVAALLTVLRAGSVVLALGVLGVFGHLMLLGSHL